MRIDNPRSREHYIYHRRVDRMTVFFVLALSVFQAMQYFHPAEVALAALFGVVGLGGAVLILWVLVMSCGALVGWLMGE